MTEFLVKFREEVVMKNVQAAISPLLIVLFLCGFGVFECPQTQIKLCLSILYTLIKWLLHIYLIIKAKIICQIFKIDFPVGAEITSIFGVSYMVLTFYYDKKFKDCLNRLNIVNETLKKLGTPNNYIKLRKQITWLIIGWIILTIFMNILSYLWFCVHMSESDIVMTIHLAMMSNHSYHICIIYDLNYMILLRYIGNQFQHVNQHIQKLTELKKQHVRHAWATSTSPFMKRQMAGTETSKHIIWLLMHVHRELCSISHKLSAIFGLQMVMQVIVFQAYTVGLIYETYETFTTVSVKTTYQLAINISDNYIWTTFNVIKMIAFNYICEELNTKANRTELFLNRLTNLLFDIETQENIMQFLLQILQRPLKISGLGFFYFGHKFTLECINYIGTIIIFTLQSHPYRDTIK